MTSVFNVKKITLLDKGIEKDKLLIGWNEWCALPQLGIPAIKAKIDTGARTSALHAFNIRSYKKENRDFVLFSLHPLQRNNNVTIECEAPIVDERYVMSSNGHKEHRYVISTPIVINDQIWDIELTLSNRDPLKFRMLLGREALNGRTMIDPFHRLLQGKLKKETLRRLYTLSA